MKHTLDEKIDTLKVLDTEILDHIDDATELADEIEQADAFRGVMYASIMKAEKALRKTPDSVSAGASAGVSGAGVSGAARNNRVKLPKLTLHSFSGDVTQWRTFWDSFKSAIDDNDQLVAVDKFNYLKSLLACSALEAIAGLTLSASNYGEAIAILERRFGNRQQIIDKHMDQLLNVNPVTSGNNLAGLRHLFNTTETHIRGLKSLGVTANSYGSLLSSVLLKKLPADIRLLISRRVSEKDWSLDAILKELQEELQARLQTSPRRAPMLNARFHTPLPHWSLVQPLEPPAAVIADKATLQEIARWSRKWKQDGKFS